MSLTPSPSTWGSAPTSDLPFLTLSLHDPGFKHSMPKMHVHCILRFHRTAYADGTVLSHAVFASLPGNAVMTNVATPKANCFRQNVHDAVMGCMEAFA